MADLGELLASLVAICATGLIVLLSVPALKQLLNIAKVRGYAPIEELYQDRDGTATQESIKAYTDLRARIALWASLSVGLGSTIALRVLAVKNGYLSIETQYHNLATACSWLDLASWIIICGQAVCLPLREQYLTRYRLTICGVLSCLTLVMSLAIRNGFSALTHLSDPDMDVKISGVLQLVELVAALAACCSFAAFPRRPDVFDKGVLVDQQFTLSLLTRLSYSWDRVIYDISKERQMKLEDIPALPYISRSRNLQANFLAKCGKGRLWWQLIKVYSYELFAQWIFTLIISLLALFPQVVLYNFLARIEAKEDYSTTDPSLFVWVSGLLLSQLLQVGFGNYLRLITTNRLEIPVQSTLQGLVFSKAIKQYETATPGEKGDDKDKSKKDTGKEDNAKDGDKDKKSPVDKSKNDQTRQSVINHMKLDTGRLNMFCTFNNNFPMAIFKLIFAGSFMIQLIGWKSTLIGLGSACLAIPFTTSISNKYGKLHFSMMKIRDHKAHLLTEALQGMRQIKYSALEQHWQNKILEARNEELKQFWKIAMWTCGLNFIFMLGPLLLACVSLSLYVWENGTNVKASVIFTALGLFDQLDEAVAMLPLLQMYMVEAWTSCVRLEKYFTSVDKETVVSSGTAIQLNNATVSWPRIEDADKEPDQPRESHSMLHDISLEFPEGKLSVIAGKTGSGKSLLLAAILGEVKLLSGTIRMQPTPPVDDAVLDNIPTSEWIVPSQTSFVSQTPWIESGTVKENIIFGLPFVEGRYNKIIMACALEKDIELLVDGDETEVGPKGVTLSGGQRWRVALARALYSRAGIIILDDVLSAVDAHVGRLIVDEALTGELAEGRTRILATHHAELVMQKASYLVRLQDGKLEEARALTPNEDNASDEKATGSKETLDDEVAAEGFPNGHDADKTTPRKDKRSKSDDDDDEKRETGRVKWKVYKQWFKASGSLFIWILCFGILVGNRSLTVVRSWSLKELSESASTADTPSLSSQLTSSEQVYFSPTRFQMTEDPERRVFFWMGMYVVLYLVININIVIRVFLAYVVGLRAAKALFERLTHAILRAPLRWIDTVPSGRILNRFTSDTFSVDRRVATDMMQVLQGIIALLIIIGTSLWVSVYIIAFGLFLLIFYTRIASQYINTAREVKRINSTSQSPIYDQFSSVLSGLSTIRAFGRTGYYMDRMYRLIDNNAKASWALNLTSRWMAFRMGLLGALFVTAVACAVALGGVDAALAGFSLSFAFRYTTALTSLLQNITSVELSCNALERVLEYAEIETEPEDGRDVPAAWPTDGKIEVQDLTVAYAEDLPPVLRNLNFTIEAGERVGVVGRTGAGKSTLAAVLFRLLQPREGSVRIDGIDIATLKLTQLRSRLAIIPQDPFLFSGTLRSNLDMEGNLDDYDLLQALQRVHLIEPPEADTERPSVYPPVQESEEPSTAATATATGIEAADTPINGVGTVEAPPIEPDATLATVDPSGIAELDTTTPSTGGGNNSSIFANLSHAVSTGGLNLSQGQRQLCCLARALLARPKIVVLDEATSAVDRGTDAAIQASLRREFAAAGCTVLVVAHRLSTVADFDRLLVLDEGRVAEVGTPRELLEAGMRREKGEGKKVAAGGGEESRGEDEGGRDDMSSGATTRVGEESRAGSVGAGEADEGEYDGTGIFWGLVQKSAEKDKLIEMILGKNG